MAHLPGVIPWQLLSRNLTPRFKLRDQVKPVDGSPPLKPDIRYRGLANEEQDVDVFLDKFQTAIREGARTMRKGFPTAYSEPKDEDEVISKDWTRAVAPFVRRWRRDISRKDGKSEWVLRKSNTETIEWLSKTEDERSEIWIKCDAKYPCHSKGQPNSISRFKGGFKWNEPCSHDDPDVGFGCGCTVPSQERQARAFTQELAFNNCRDFIEIHAKPQFNSMITRTLILTGNMVPLLRMAARPDNTFERWEHVQACICVNTNLGWGKVYEKAIHAYLILNVLSCFPVLAPSALEDQAQGLELDYRRTASYQDLLEGCTKVSAFNDHHRQVLEHDSRRVFRDDRTPLQMSTSFVEFLAQTKEDSKDDNDASSSSTPSLNPLADDVVDAVRAMSHANGLPLEVTLTILEYVQAEDSGALPKSIFPVKHDPLHPDNRSELLGYLEECWLVILRCEMLAQEAAFTIDWSHLANRWIGTRYLGVVREEEGEEEEE